MNTGRLTFYAYGQTTGGPVCIANATDSVLWSGCDKETSDYWTVSSQLSQLTNQDNFYVYKQFLLFNTETGNFIILKGQKSIAIVEAIYIDSEMDSIVADFKIIREEPLINKFTADKIMLFDSSLTLSHIPDEPSCYKVSHSEYNNLIILDFHFDSIQEIEYQTEDIYLTGIRLLNNAPVGP